MNTNSSSNNNPQQWSQLSLLAETERKAYSHALARTLSFAGVKFVRYFALDVTGNPRCKAIPVDCLLQRRRHGGGNEDSTTTIDRGVPTAQVCFAGLNVLVDSAVDGSGLDARHQVVLVPDLTSLQILPYSPTSAMMFGILHDQKTGLPSDLCCRGLLRNVVQKAFDELNIGFNVGCEVEFCLYDAKTNEPVDVSNFGCVFTLNRQDEFVNDAYEQLQRQDVDVELLHAESAPGQLELVLAYCDDPVQMADNVVLARETITNVARRHGMKALFLPKFNPTTAGNGAHVHLSFYDSTTKENLFVNDESSLRRRRQSFLAGASAEDISTKGRSFMEGILQHLPGLLALTMPTRNSFRRVGPGCWTGSEETWAFEDKESPLRVVASLHEQRWEHFEVKVCDATANIYLALAGLLIAGMDGLKRQLELRDDRETANQPPLPLPDSIEKSLDCLERDEVLCKNIPAVMMRGYLAVRRADAARTAKMTIKEELKEALERA